MTVSDLFVDCMETLRAIRDEEIIYFEDPVSSGADNAQVTMQLKENNNSILIVTKHSSNTVQQVLSKIEDDKSGYVFFASEIVLDPIKNGMVPLHRKATSQEIDYLKSRKIPLNKLPILCMKDPIRRWYNFKKDSVVAIERPNEQHLYFRRVA